LWKVLYLENKLYGPARINGQNKNGGPKYMDYISSSYWKGSGQNDQERMNEGFRSKGAVERRGYVGHFWHAIYPHNSEGSLHIFEETCIFD
jgi:hypothetical protein